MIILKKRLLFFFSFENIILSLAIIFIVIAFLCSDLFLRTTLTLLALIFIGISIHRQIRLSIECNQLLHRNGKNNSYLFSLHAAFRELSQQMTASSSKATSFALSQREAELCALQSQINPHFLYNTLDAIRGQALTLGAEDVAEMTEALSMMLRYSISHDGDLVTLKDELRNSEQYIKLQQFRFRHRFMMEYHIPEDAYHCILPRLTIQPIVENAIYYGLEGKKRGGRLVFRVFVTDQTLVIHITDDGAGMSKEQVAALNQKITHTDMPKSSDSSGIALPNVHRRIQLLFGSSYGVSVSSTERFGTDVQVTLPYISDVQFQHNSKEVLFYGTGS